MEWLVLWDNLHRCFWLQTSGVRPDPAPRGSLGSHCGRNSHWGWGPPGLLPAPSEHQQVHIPFHEEIVPARPPEHLRGDSSWLGPWEVWGHLHPCHHAARDSWGLLSKGSSAHPCCVLLLQRKTRLSLWAPSWCRPVLPGGWLPATGAPAAPLTDATSPATHTCWCRWTLSCLHVTLMRGCDHPGIQRVPSRAGPPSLGPSPCMASWGLPGCTPRTTLGGDPSRGSHLTKCSHVPHTITPDPSPAPWCDRGTGALPAPHAPRARDTPWLQPAAPTFSSGEKEKRKVSPVP